MITESFKYYGTKRCGELTLLQRIYIGTKNRYQYLQPRTGGTKNRPTTNKDCHAVKGNKGYSLLVAAIFGSD